MTEKNLLKEISSDPKRHIKMEIEDGTYIVDMKDLGIDSTAALPEKVRILPGKTVHLKASIDTGIR